MQLFYIISISRVIFPLVFFTIIEFVRWAHYAHQRRKELRERDLALEISGAIGKAKGIGQRISNILGRRSTQAGADDSTLDEGSCAEAEASVVGELPNLPRARFAADVEGGAPKKRPLKRKFSTWVPSKFIAASQLPAPGVFKTFRRMSSSLLPAALQDKPKKAAPPLPTPAGLPKPEKRWLLPRVR